MRYLKRFLLLFAFITSVSRAAETGTLSSQYLDPVAGMTLQDLFQMALQNNSSLLEAQLKIKEAEALQMQAGARPNPELEISGETSSIAGEAGDNEWGTSYVHTVELGGKRGNRIRVADLMVQVFSEEARERKREVFFQLSRSFAEVLGGADSLRAIEEMISVATETHRITTARVEEGEAAAIEKSLSEVELSRLRTDATALYSQILSEWSVVKRIAGSSAHADMKIRGELPGFPQLGTKAYQELLLLARKGRPDLQVAILMEELSTAEVDAAKSQGTSDLNAFIEFRNEKSRFDQLGLNEMGIPVQIQDSDKIVSGGISLKLPLFDRNQGNIQAAQTRQQSAQTKKKALEKNIEIEIASALERYNLAKANYEQFRDSILGLSEQQLQVIRASYEAGESRIMDLLNQQRALLQVRQSLIASAKEYFLASVELEHVTAFSIVPQGGSR